MYKKDQIIVTPHGKAKITVVDVIEKVVRVEHLESITPITDYRFSDLMISDVIVSLSKQLNGDDVNVEDCISKGKKKYYKVIEIT